MRRAVPRENKGRPCPTSAGPLLPLDARLCKASASDLKAETSPVCFTHAVARSPNSDCGQSGVSGTVACPAPWVPPPAGRHHPLVAAWLVLTTRGSEGGE